MAAPAVIRVKRARSEQPLEALVLSSKRRKREGDGEDTPITTVLTFAGTVNTQEKNVHSQLSKVFVTLKEKSETDAFKAHTPKVTEKLRERLKTKWQQDRYKVVSLSRSQGNVEEASESGQRPNNDQDITVVDIEPTETHESSNDDAQVPDTYEYDLYYAETTADFYSGVMDGVLSVLPYDLVNEAELSDEEQLANDSDNEDDENNWRNDYPDEQSDDEDEEVGGRRCGRYGDDDSDELMDRMAKCGLDSGEELSSDDDDEALVYGRPESPFERYRARCVQDFEDDPDLQDS